MKLLKRIIPFVGAVLAVPIFMTSSVCHWKFAWAWKMDGQCAASDTPSEVFLSFLAIASIAAATIVFVWLLLWALFRLLTKYAQEKVTK